jgi:hypothetical protein
MANLRPDAVGANGEVNADPSEVGDRTHIPIVDLFAQMQMAVGLGVCNTQQRRLQCGAMQYAVG